MGQRIRSFRSYRRSLVHAQALALYRHLVVGIDGAVVGVIRIIIGLATKWLGCIDGVDGMMISIAFAAAGDAGGGIGGLCTRGARTRASLIRT